MGEACGTQCDATTTHQCPCSLKVAQRVGLGRGRLLGLLAAQSDDRGARFDLHIGSIKPLEASSAAKGDTIHESHRFKERLKAPFGPEQRYRVGLQRRWYRGVPPVVTTMGEGTPRTMRLRISSRMTTWTKVEVGGEVNRQVAGGPRTCFRHAATPPLLPTLPLHACLPPALPPPAPPAAAAAP